MIGAARDRVRIVGELRELIAALDRRVPQEHRAGEAEIVEAAAQLRFEALHRIEALERETPRSDEPDQEGTEVPS